MERGRVLCPLYHDFVRPRDDHRLNAAQADPKEVNFSSEAPAITGYMPNAPGIRRTIVDSFRWGSKEGRHVHCIYDSDHVCGTGPAPALSGKGKAVLICTEYRTAPYVLQSRLKSRVSNLYQPVRECLPQIPALSALLHMYRVETLYLDF
ncbi:uncharacterized protein KD926_010969 [Aspergillus affinis]|uniref:uncharacterized protein n=1 Tax=Aspergillus affinis TaxID=1070780 RepID=UPI0022FE88DC|nr:uncharacterized protein KD926_010969 [Aspergillus affinis]KAI9044797.1 hypothetical protein KD926_010969 [Aspergillus affinis]